MTANLLMKSIISAVLSLAIAVSTASAADIVVKHSGSNDPATEGWTRAATPSTDLSEGPVKGDSGLDAWKIKDDSKQQEDMMYTLPLSDEQLAQASSAGWSLKANLRIVNPGDDADSAIQLAFGDGTTLFNMFIGSTTAGDPYVVCSVPQTASTPNFVFQGGGSGYHLYEMRYDPASKNVSVFIDDVEQITGYAGVPSTKKIVSWGAERSVTVGEANYNFVEFSSPPSKSAQTQPATQPATQQ